MKTQWGLFAKFALIAIGFMGLNFLAGDRLCPVSREFARWPRERTTRFYRSILILILLAGCILAVPMMFLWENFLRYDNRVLAGVIPVFPQETPVLQKDIGFYLFEFPFYRWVSLWVKALLWLNVAVVGLLYNFYHHRDPQTMAKVEHRVVFHGSVLWLMLLGVSLWRSQINIWNVLNTSRAPWGLGHVDGMGYIDDKLIGAYHVYMLCIGLIGIALLVNVFWRKRLIWYSTIAIWGLSYLVLIQVYPIVVHWTKVRPSPGSAKRPFIKTHIASTRQAFGLDSDRLEEREITSKAPQRWSRSAVTPTSKGIFSCGIGECFTRCSGSASERRNITSFILIPMLIGIG